MIQASSATDPYYIKPVSEGADNFASQYGGARTIRDPRLNAGEATGVFVVAGQSNCCNSVNALYTPTNESKIDNLNLYDGGTYAAADPLLGCFTGPAAVGGNVFLRVADKLITSGVFSRVILVPVGVGGSTISRWAAGGDLNSRTTVASIRVAAVGLPVTAFLWMQGESDHGISQAAYASYLASVIATPRSIGFNAPWLIGKCTLLSGAVDANVRAAQADALNGADIFAGADTDSLTGLGVNRQSDDTHLNATGADAAATLWKNAIDAVF